MHPAASIIIFTTLSGAGFGLIGFAGLGVFSDARPTILAAGATAFALALAGLLSSTLHLGHPERAWRALSQWRSSWLSREGVLALVTLAAFAVYAGLWYLTGFRAGLAGYAVAVLAALTVIATAMIYASLKTVPRWHTVLTPLCYLLFASAGGGLLAALIEAMTVGFDRNLATAALILLVLAWAAKSAWWARADRTGLADAGSTPESATGLGDLGKVRLLEAPHTSPNYLMREMVHRIGRKHAQTLRLIALGLGGALPTVLVLVAIIASGSWMLLLVATVSHFVGVLAERWLFFAEAEHAVSLYYGHR